MVLDADGFNVALNKPVTSSPLQPASNICLASGCLPSGGNNGVIDNTQPGNSDGYISLSLAGDAFWQVDLQVRLWNRFAGASSCWRWL